jgi:hypothetical protein
VGLGESQEAAFNLRASVPAGAYHVICDAIITDSVDTTFTLIWRRGSNDTTLAEWSGHWDPLGPGMFSAQAYELDVSAPAIDFKPGDQLVFRYHGVSARLREAFIPNGDGDRANGRLPNIRLPQ